MKFAGILLASVLSLCSAAFSADAPPKAQLAVAAAASMKFALEDINAAFMEAHPEIEVKTTYGSSGNFFAQLSNKAPFDVFLSADRAYPFKLLEKGLAVKDSFFVYAIGRIVLWAPKSGLDVKKLGLEAILSPSMGKLAIANPKLAPYGRAAEAALKSLGAYEKLQDKIVLGDNIEQAAQFAYSGAASAGIVALSLAVSPKMKDAGDFWPFPESSYPPIEQACVTLSWAANPAAAAAYCAFIAGPEGSGILEKYGFAKPAAKKYPRSQGE